MSKISSERSQEMFDLAGVDRDAFMRAMVRMGPSNLKTAQMRREYDESNPTRNYCYVVAEWVKYFVFDPKEKTVTAWKLEVEGYDTFHNFIRVGQPYGKIEIIDLSAEQFPDYSKVDYDKATRTTFMMAPSKRARLLDQYYREEVESGE